MYFKIYRDCDVLRLRKVVIELYDNEGALVDRRRMFGYPMFSARCRAKQRRMIRLAKRMAVACAISLK